MSESRASRIVLHKTVEGFFREVVTAAIENQRVQTHALAIAYIADVLKDYARTEKLHDGHDTGPADQPLAAQMCRAMAATPDSRVTLLKQLGDVCLYVAGMFSDSLNRKLVDVDYYMQMGEGAYATVSATMRIRRGGEDFALLYDELSGKFDKFVDVLQEVSEQSSLTTNMGTLRVYEKWLRTSSARLERELKERGVIPCESARTKFVQ